MKLSLLVLAAGMGSRYGGLKQLDPIGPNGESLLEYCVYDSLQSGFSKAVLIIRKDFENDFRASVGKRIEAMTEVEYVYQEIAALPLGFKPKFARTKPWGTAHAIWSARHKINVPFAVINADDFYGRDALKAIANFLASTTSQHYAMVAYRLANTLSEFGSVARGVCQVDPSGYLSAISETFDIERDATGVIRARAGASLSDQQLVSMNLWGFTPDIFAAIEKRLIEFVQDPSLSQSSEFYIPRVVEQLIASDQAKVKVLSTASQWFGLTYRQDRDAARTAISRAIERGEFPASLVS